MSYGLGNELNMFEAALEAADLAWWVIELPSGTVFFSENKTKMLGRKAKDFVHYSHFTDLLHKDDYDCAMLAMTDHLTGKKPLYETKYRIKGANGKYRTFYDRGKIVGRDKKGGMTVAGIVMDITKYSPENL